MTTSPDPAAPQSGRAWELPQQLPIPAEVQVLAPPGAQDRKPRKPHSRNNLLAVVVLGLILALGLGMGSWVLLGRPWFQSPTTTPWPIVARLGKEPAIAWSLQLDSSSSDVFAVDDDKVAVFDSENPGAGLRLLSLADGKQLWATKFDGLSAGGSGSQILVRRFRGTERIIVDFINPEAATKSIAYFDVKTGERLGSYSMDLQSSIVAADDGSPILVGASDGENSTISLLKSWDPSDTRWSVQTEGLAGDGDRKFVVKDGLLLLGPSDFGVHVSSIYCDAFSVETGATPAWLEPGGCFQSVGSDARLFQKGDGPWVMKGTDGSTKWSQTGADFEFRALGDELYLIQRSTPSTIRRYNPADGKPMWSQAVPFDGYVALARYEGQLFALVSDESSAITRLNAANGDVEARVEQPSFPQYLPGEGQILAVSSKPQGVDISATEVRGDGIRWSTKFKNYPLGFQLGRYLALRDPDSLVVSVLS